MNFLKLSFVLSQVLSSGIPVKKIKWSNNRVAADGIEILASILAVAQRLLAAAEHER
jgi:hypothetical protein